MNQIILKKAAHLGVTAGICILSTLITQYNQKQLIKNTAKDLVKEMYKSSRKF